MIVPDLSQLGESKVALRMTKAVSGAEQESEIKIEEYLTDEGVR